MLSALRTGPSAVISLSGLGIIAGFPSLFLFCSQSSILTFYWLAGQHTAAFRHCQRAALIFIIFLVRSQRLFQAHGYDLCPPLPKPSCSTTYAQFQRFFTFPTDSKRTLPQGHTVLNRMEKFVLEFVPYLFMCGFLRMILSVTRKKSAGILSYGKDF